MLFDFSCLIHLSLIIFSVILRATIFTLIDTKKDIHLHMVTKIFYNKPFQTDMAKWLSDLTQKANE